MGRARALPRLVVDECSADGLMFAGRLVDRVRDDEGVTGGALVSSMDGMRVVANGSRTANEQGDQGRTARATSATGIRAYLPSVCTGAASRSTSSHSGIRS